MPAPIPSFKLNWNFDIHHNRFFSRPIAGNDRRKWRRKNKVKTVWTIWRTVWKQPADTKWNLEGFFFNGRYGEWNRFCKNQALSSFCRLPVHSNRFKLIIFVLSTFFIVRVLGLGVYTYRRMPKEDKWGRSYILLEILFPLSLRCFSRI